MILLAIALLFLGWLLCRTARQLEREARRVPAAAIWVDVPGPVKLAHSSDGRTIRVTYGGGEYVFTFDTPMEAMRALELSAAYDAAKADRIVSNTLAEVVRRLVAGKVMAGSQN